MAINVGRTLVEDWKNAHKWASMRLAAGFAALLGVGPSLIDGWSSIPQDIKDQLPHGWARYITTTAFILVMLARVTTPKPPTGVQK